jgi:hypothetical protein
MGILRFCFTSLPMDGRILRSTQMTEIPTGGKGCPVAPRQGDKSSRRRNSRDYASYKHLEEGDTQDTPVANNTKNIVKLLVSDLRSDDLTVIQKALTDLADLCQPTKTDLYEANKSKIHQLGGHMAVVQGVKKRVDNVLIQEEGF